LQAFGIYAVGFVSRPVGAALFGHYGDRVGRKVTLIATLLLTGLSTFAVGFVRRPHSSPKLSQILGSGGRPAFSV
jgi:MFS family permease